MARHQDEPGTDAGWLNVQPERVTVWWTTCLLPQPESALDALLSSEEKERAARFVRAEDRHSFATAHALVRVMLSRFAAVDPADWRFTAGPFGKPAIFYPASYAGLQFNISHTRGLAACAVAPNWPVGVDVEAITRQADCAMLASTVFSPTELASWRNMPPDQQQRNFFRYWTLKEAYIKTCGLGLSLPLDSFSFTLREDGPPALAIHTPHDDTPGDWHFRQFEILSTYLLAVGVRTERGQSVEFEIREAPDPIAT